MRVSLQDPGSVNQGIAEILTVPPFGGKANILVDRKKSLQMTHPALQKGSKRGQASRYCNVCIIGGSFIDLPQKNSFSIKSAPSLARRYTNKTAGKSRKGERNDPRYRKGMNLVGEKKEHG